MRDMDIAKMIRFLIEYYRMDPQSARVLLARILEEVRKNEML